MAPNAQPQESEFKVRLQQCHDMKIRPARLNLKYAKTMLSTRIIPKVAGHVLDANHNV